MSSFGLVELPLSVTANAAARLLASRGVESRKWWGEGCHRQTAYRDCGRTLLPNTERLGDQVLGLPFWLGLRRQDMRLVFQALDDALSELKVA